MYGQQFVVPSGLTVSYLLIGGGGGGSWSGGGAGGVLQGTTTLTPNTYNIIVGTGGTGAYNTTAQQGGNTIFNNLTAFGGGAGVYYDKGITGGSGSGGAQKSDPPYAGGGSVTGQGNSGGSSGGDTNMDVGGGGGGAGGNGGQADDATGNGGSGGIGITSNITGFNVDYAGGGGGTGNLFDTYHTNAWDGGGGSSYGGGHGGSNGFDPSGDLGNAIENTGGGGGGQRSGAGGKGGAGIIVISYPGTTPRATGGDYQYTIGGNYIHVFNRSDTNTTYNLNTNLLAFWNMDEASTGTRYDSSGNGNNLTDYFNNTGYTSGIISNAARFNGSNNFLSINSIFNTRNDFSVSMWVYASSHRYGNDHIIGSPFNSGWFGQIADTYYQFGFPGTASSGVSVMLRDPLPDPLTNTFRHYVFTKQGNTIKLYRNKIQIKDFTNNVAFGVNSSQPFYVGAGFSQYFFDGAFDAVGIWSRALVPGEISYLYDHGNGKQAPLSTSVFIDDTKLIVT